MTPSTNHLNGLVEKWTLDGHHPIGRQVINGNGDRKSDDDTFNDILLQLEHLSDRFFCRYIPALYPPYTPAYLDRLWNWINNGGLTEVQQRLLFEFAARITYFSFEDFLQLYRTAFIEPVTRWIIDELALSLNSNRFYGQLERERRRRTWYCAVTDSMVISEFYHVNGISGIDQRPVFRSLMQFASHELIEDYMAENGLQRLVLLEDFVCTSNQSTTTIEWAATSLSCPILFVPLVICPGGEEPLLDIAEKFSGRLQIRPVVRLDDVVFVNPDGGTKDVLFSRIHALAQAVQANLIGRPDTSGGPFGYGSRGATVVLFSNTPDNTLPLVHHHARAPSNWRALFPRVGRETI